MFEDVRGANSRYIPVLIEDTLFDEQVVDAERVDPLAVPSKTCVVGDYRSSESEILRAASGVLLDREAIAEVCEFAVFDQDVLSRGQAKRNRRRRCRAARRE